MAGPLIARAALALLRRYGLKKLGHKELKDIRGKAIARTKGGASRKEIRKAAGKARRRQVGTNILGDTGSGYLLGDAVNSSLKIDKFKSKKELRDYIKKNKPKAWREFTRSEFDDIEEFLKSKKV